MRRRTVMMTFNENKIDRGLRIILGLILLGGSISLVIPWAGTVMNLWGLVLGVVGLIPLLTGLIGWCPMYALFKFSTCEMNETGTYCGPKDTPRKAT